MKVSFLIIASLYITLVASDHTAEHTDYEVAGTTAYDAWTTEAIDPKVAEQEWLASYFIFKPCDYGEHGGLGVGGCASDEFCFKPEYNPWQQSGRPGETNTPRCVKAVSAFDKDGDAQCQCMLNPHLTYPDYMNTYFENIPGIYPQASTYLTQSVFRNAALRLCLYTYWSYETYETVPVFGLLDTFAPTPAPPTWQPTPTPYSYSAPSPSPYTGSGATTTYAPAGETTDYEAATTTDYDYDGSTAYDPRTDAEPYTSDYWNPQPSSEPSWNPIPGFLPYHAGHVSFSESELWPRSNRDSAGLSYCPTTFQICSMQAVLSECGITIHVASAPEFETSRGCRKDCKTAMSSWWQCITNSRMNDVGLGYKAALEDYVVDRCKVASRDEFFAQFRVGDQVDDEQGDGKTLLTESTWIIVSVVLGVCCLGALAALAVTCMVKATRSSHASVVMAPMPRRQHSSTNASPVHRGDATPHRSRRTTRREHLVQRSREASGAHGNTTASYL